MKTVISIPDDVFKKADRLARRLGISRSQLFRLAVEEYVNKRWPESITEAMNRVVHDTRARRDEFIAVASRAVLAKTEW